jgi:N-acetylmuramoyl-L-alanine amidase
MPAPGETVVSAVSPEPLDNASPTQEVPTSQPVIEESPTAEVVAAAEPAAAPTATKVAPPPPTLTTTSSDEGQTVVHKVTAGETLSGIADRYGTTSQAIAVANNISDPSTIIPGTELKIPTSGASLGESSSRESGEGDSSGCRLRHRVKKGEWVWQIARKYGVDPQKVMRANDLTSRKAKTLQPGTILCIP